MTALGGALLLGLLRPGRNLQRLLIASFVFSTALLIYEVAVIVWVVLPSGEPGGGEVFFEAALAGVLAVSSLLAFVLRRGVVATIGGD